MEPDGASLCFVHQFELRRRGAPGYETVLNLIGSTQTRKGLRVKAKLDKKHNETGKKISDEEIVQLNIKYAKVNPQWNYTIYPRTQNEKVEE